MSSLEEVESRLLEEQLAGLQLGTQLTISVNGQVTTDIAIGNALPGVPLTSDSLSIWKSSGKPVAAVAVMQLVERDKIDLDDPVTRFIPEFASHGKAPITIHHLLTHTGGFREERFLLPDDEWQAVIAHIADTPLEEDWVPGETAGYHSLSSWFILAEIVQIVDGSRFADYVREHIFKPLGMDDCWIGMPTEVYDRYLDAGRIAALPDTSRDPVDLGQHHTKEAITPTNPGGGLCGPANQLVRLYEMFLGGGERDGVRVLEPETVGHMTARHRVGMMDQTFRYPMQWGLGLILEPPDRKGRMPYGYGRHASPQAFGHAGRQSSVAFADPAHDLAVALAFVGMPGEMEHQRRIDAVLTSLYEELGLTG